MRPALSAYAPEGVPEVVAGDDLVSLLLDALGDHALADGDIVAITSKVVSKAEGQVRASTREEELPGETRRVVARRGATTIVRNRLGLTLAAAGIDASNVAPGHVVLHPRDPDGSARAVRDALAERTGCNVGVVVTDTAGRAWREGQTDIAIGAAGIEVLESFVGREDAHGNSLVVTAPAVADELASLTELVSGKLGGRPFAILRGRGDLVLPPGEHGSGAHVLIREEGRDFFGYGAREAVVRALAGRSGDRAPFGAAASAEEVAEAVHTVLGLTPQPGGEELLVAHPADGVVRALAFAHGWTASPMGDAASRLSPITT